MSARPRLTDLATHPRKYVSLSEAARFLEIDRATLNKYLAEGLMPTVRHNGRRRLEVAALARFEREARRR